MSELFLDGCEVPDDQMLGKPGAGMAMFTSSMLWERSCILASTVGTMEHQLEQTIEELIVLAPCGFDDALRIHTRVTELRGARFRFEYVVERTSEPSATIAEGWTAHACVDATTLRPTRMPAWLAEGIAGAEAG